MTGTKRPRRTESSRTWYFEAGYFGAGYEAWWLMRLTNVCYAGDWVAPKLPVLPRGQARTVSMELGRD
jgi:hypothetical protein